MATALAIAVPSGAQPSQFQLVDGFSTVFDGFRNILVGSDGNLYLPTVEGSVFRISPSCAAENIHDFHWQNPGSIDTLLQGLDGNLYGTMTPYLEPTNFFRMDLAGNVQLLYQYPSGVSTTDLIQASDGNFYGVTPTHCTQVTCTPPPFPHCHCTQSGGGTIYRLDAQYNLTTLITLGPETAVTNLLQGLDDNFYGALNSTGGGFGEIFRMDASGNYTTVHAFDCDTDGNVPDSLVQSSDGNLHGTTLACGPTEGGTVFSMDLAGNITTQRPFGPAFVGNKGVLQSADGNLYGWTTNGGANGLGEIFRVDASGNLSTLFDFFDANVAYPGGLVQTADGDLWGLLSSNFFGQDAVFRLTSTTLAINSIVPSSGPYADFTSVYILGGGFVPGASVTTDGAPVPLGAVLDPNIISGNFRPALGPGTLNDVTITNPGSPGPSVTLTGGFFADFLDVPQSDVFHDAVERIFRDGITAGCTGGYYCRDYPLLRDQIAVFLLKAEHGPTYIPPSCTGQFLDVPCPSPFADWIEAFSAEGITGGCGGDNFCPSDPATRAEVAVFLLKARHGSGYVPPVCSGLFVDVPCPSTFANWIEELYAEGITGGCQASPLLYCPNDSLNRGQAAAFLVNTFVLP